MDPIGESVDQVDKALEALRNPSDYIFSHGLSKKLQPLTHDPRITHVAVRNNNDKYGIKIPLTS